MQTYQTKESARSPLRKALLWIALISFTSYSTWVMWDIGYFGIWQSGLNSNASLQILLDMVIACIIIGVWMIDDAKSRGKNPVPWVIAAILTCSIALVAYLLVREYQLQGTTPSANIDKNALTTHS